MRDGGWKRGRRGRRGHRGRRLQEENGDYAVNYYRGLLEIKRSAELNGRNTDINAGPLSSKYLEDVQKNMRIDKDRIYLTGLSMGGRGTYIVAAKLPHYFAALMPLSPHHQPYSYLSLASKVSHLPIWMSHGTADKISSYDMASQMAEELKKENKTSTVNKS